MRSRLRLAAPWKALFTLAIVFAVSAASIRILLPPGVGPESYRFPTGTLFFAAAAYGVYRACYFHPYFRSGYRAWLATTPWTVDKPLPFGPIELDWPDVVVLGALILMYAVVPDHQSARIIAVFLFFHGLFLTISIYNAANHVPAYAALFGLGLMVRLWPQPWACALTGVVVYLIEYDGLRISLRSFPWAATDSPTPVEDAERTTFDPARASCGWPYDRLLKDPQQAPGAPETRPEAPFRPAGIGTNLEEMPWHRLLGTKLDYLMWSLLLGWWASCFGPILAEQDRYPTFLSIATLAVVSISFITRLSLYKMGYASPIGEWGRIRTGRWIIPGHDVFALALVLIPIAPALTFWGLVVNGVPWRIAGPIALSVALFVALATPPGLRRWRLVGRHRLVPGQARSAAGS
ncbi:hypothetical protein [Paludisphaera mucosa]|uniref:HTTM domain-containing protein n=1 Tax=Paludisphaera mucosa TaxID=3030827 RepID=A0ABT6F7Y0_9BACT|nr:hypothetical protein [Paludisphaera mucosa]MDG3003696.1 hypothetical protein [Paludisphaera mucosa]